MPNINDVFPSKFLKAHELQGREPIVTIDRVEFEQVGQKREVVPVLYFVGKEKGIKVNKTIANKVIEISGSAITEEWHGVKVKLYATETTYGGDTYDVVRIKAANGGAMSRFTPVPPLKPPPSEADAFDTPLTDEDIPF